MRSSALPSSRRPIGRIARSAFALLVASTLSATLAGCPRDRAESKQPNRPPAVPVAVAPVEQKSMPVQIQAIGTVEAYSVVSVRAQVGGELTQVHFKEGQDVKKGELLFTIDPRPFDAALAQAEANLARDKGLIAQARAALDRDRAKVSQTQAALARDKAQAKNADVEATRYAELLQRGLIAQEQADQFRTTAESLSHTVLADEADIKSAEETVRADEAAVNSAQQAVKADDAAVDNAKIQLGYTTISSPIDGRTGSLMLHEGNVVRSGGTSDSTLVVINQVQPIYVSFTVPQQQLPTIKRYMADGRLEVWALPPGETQPLKGVVTFIDNAVDQTTGTIRLKATFPNEERRLWPGQFVNASLTLTVDPNAIVVPSAAIQSGQQGQYVFVVKDGSTVDMRRVTVKRTQGSETVIADGLKPGESVVVDGQPRLVAGARVEVRRPGGRPAESPPRGPADSPPRGPAPARAPATKSG
ncbi:MAG TPA: efflux RND transporter periplasmic adaptor subunit [Candidatus Methylomirabilis sp.]|nr:efflux RND transporter periplasmic adaptor subunit [Candidatus Methylomirabilis sp.]